MFLPIKNLPDSSRIWIYQSTRQLTQQDEKLISENLKAFCDQWAAHGAGLQTSFQISHHRFVILALNEQPASASGCSIDSSTRALKDLGQQLGIDFFNHSIVAFYENESIIAFSLADIKKLFAEGRLNENSITFNMQAATLGEWRSRPTSMVRENWLKRYMMQVVK